MFILPKANLLNNSLSSSNNSIENISQKINLLLETKESGFSKSNKNYYQEIFAHYFKEKNNCLDFIALCNEIEIVGYQIHPDFENRLKTNNVKTNVQSQSNKYKSLASEYTRILNGISDELCKIDQGGLKKIAFDVEVGGIFYYIFNNNKEKTQYLFGATVDQGSMDSGLAYREMEDIFEEVNRQI
jgi:hypothetical protein